MSAVDHRLELHGHLISPRPGIRSATVRCESCDVRLEVADTLVGCPCGSTAVAIIDGRLVGTGAVRVVLTRGQGDP